LIAVLRVADVFVPDDENRETSGRRLIERIRHAADLGTAWTKDEIHER